MELVIKINMDGAAFEENAAEELTTILTNVAAHYWRLRWEYDNGMLLRDSNGNTVGQAVITE